MAASENWQEKRILTLIKGREQYLLVTDEIRDRQAFMFPAYYQAVRVLLNLVQQTDFFHDRNSVENHRRADLDNLLFQYSGNILAFAAQRGGGKTRMMLSFSKILSEWNNECSKDVFSNGEEESKRRIDACKFFVLPPIAPSTLEGTQNILYIVLSRLFQYAEELLAPGNSHVYLCEKEKSELFLAFQNCLSGINGIKRPSKSQLEDLSALQDINDGIALKYHFYTLVQCLLRISAPKTKIQDCYLVLQLDDTDSQGQKSYEVLEDIRKYLLLPNLIILVSADSGMLHSVILDTYRKQFETDEYLEKELSRMCRKYIDKLIPPSNMIHLPQLDKYLEVAGNQLSLLYLNLDKTPVLTWADKSWNFQNIILMLIYRKTGVIFVRPHSYTHNIIPKTMRGLNQLFFFLNDMQDIPKLTAADWSDLRKFVETNFQQIQIKSKNLQLFTDYFVNDWIPVKVYRADDRNFLKEFFSTVSVNRTRLTLSYFKKRYPESQQGSKDNISIEELLEIVEKQHRGYDDFLLYFSIRTILTLENHRMVTWNRLETIQKYLGNFEKRGTGDEDFPRILVYDLVRDGFEFPGTYQVNDTARQTVLGEKTNCVRKKFSNKRIINQNICLETTLENTSDLQKEFEKQMEAGAFKQDAKRFFSSVMVEKCDKTYSIKALNILTILLRLGKKELKTGKCLPDLSDYDVMWEQSLFYLLQELALLIACNWDVRSKIRKYLKIDISSGDREKKRLERIYAVFAGLDIVLGNINNGELLKDLETQALCDGWSWKLEATMKEYLTKRGKVDTLLDGDSIEDCINIVMKKDDNPQHTEKPTAAPTPPTSTAGDESLEDTIPGL